MYNFMQKIRKNYSAVLAVEPERADGHTHGSEFIGSFPVNRGTKKVTRHFGGAKYEQI